VNNKFSRGLSAEAKTHMNSVVGTYLLGLIKVSCRVLCANVFFLYSFCLAETLENRRRL
jgi:hypothetical protein